MRVTQRDEELAVVRDEHDATAQAGDEGLEPVEPGEVEVVGRLVEQDDVEAAEQQGGQRRAGRLPARQRGHEGVVADVEPELAEHRGDAVLEVRGAAREPVVEGDAVCRVGAGRVAAPSAARRRLHRLGGGGGAGAAGDVVGDGLAGDALVLLRQPADERVAGSRRDGAGQRGRLAGEEAQERGLARAVGADDPDDVARARR